MKKTAADIGCGIGRTVPMLAEHFRSVQATDMPAPMPWNWMARAERIS